MKNAPSISLTLVALSAGILASSAFGAETVFKNHLKSQAIVSPAQLYQVNQTKSDFQLGFANGSAETKTDAGKQKADVSGTDVFAAAIYSQEAMNLRAGLGLDYKTAKSEIKDVNGNNTGGDGTMLTVTPQASIVTGPVALGVSADVVQKTFEPDATGSSTRKFSYNRPHVGAALIQPTMEVGLAYTGKVDTSKTIDGLKYETKEPSALTAHGRWALDSTMAMGGTVSNVYTSELEAGNVQLDDQLQTRAIWEMLNGPMKVEADLGYNTSYYDGKEFATTDNIATWEVGAAADYSVSDASNVGVAANYEWGSDKGANNTKLNVSATSFAVRGNVRF